ncbi:Putative inositol-1-monophosphatase (fragment) [Candidatus Filomicrobium marinum]|uniref:Putative inositol-1-monophosphatase n=1 Tax=Candidatus Filomicrobium marinum TaxID=1608628 RepID=A0A0D6JB11_9HYPH
MMDTHCIKRIELLAVEFANLAGAEIKSSLGTMHAVRYKSGKPELHQWGDPVSEVDENIESLIRLRLAQQFPEHDIIGEEIDVPTGKRHDFSTRSFVPSP